MIYVLEHRNLLICVIPKRKKFGVFIIAFFKYMYILQAEEHFILSVLEKQL